ncbi:MAG: branched-chain amino acid transport system ATP-binding protein livM [Actinomycetota bacterium]|jgi:branched-chain amino acid transport system permease protein|nr:branched-chain amino acid transport system ATP-binding protein livM [Actinomycetota bacterium]
MMLLRRVPRGHAAAGLVFVLLAIYPVFYPYATYYQTVLLQAFLLSLQAVSWNIVSGYAGYVSLGHSAYLGLGSYTTAILALHWGVNPLLVAPLGGVTAVVIALALGVIVLRTRGHAFVIITIALLLAMQIVATNWRSLTKGSDGITLELPTWSRDIQNVPFYYAFLLLLALTVLFSAWIRRTKFGAGLVAIREDEGKASAIGVNTTRYKVLAYVASTFFIGVAGGVYAYFLTFLNPVGAFSILASVMIVLAALAGGRGTLYGPAVGGFIVSIGGEVATVHGGSSSRVLIFGVALTLVVLFMPSGLLPTVEGWWRRRHAETTEYTDQAGALAAGAVTAPGRAAAPALAQALLEPTGVESAEPVLLDVRKVSKRFGGLVAVDGADLTVRRGSITALIGPNGSGKTTLFNLVTGAMRADSGEVWLDGRRIDTMAPWQRGHLGLARTFQTTRLFKSMTVQQNLVAPLPDSGWRRMLASAVSGSEADRARELLDFVGLGRFAHRPAGSLSYGQQKLVELAQVLMLEPRIVLLDEPAGGVNPSLVGRLGDIVRDLNRQGVTFLVVEHNIPMVLELCDPVVVFSRGSSIAEGPPDRIREDPLVLDAYLGDEWRPPGAEVAAGPDAVTGTSVEVTPGRSAAGPPAERGSS